MSRKSKRFKAIQKLIQKDKSYTLSEAVDVLKSSPKVGFDESIEIALRLGVDSKKSDQQVRSTVFLPHGSGKTIRLVVLAKEEAKQQEALDSGADFAGDQDLIHKIKEGWTDFDAVIATPDMMREVGKLGKILGPRNLMPTPRTGTVTNDIKKAVEDLKKGKVEFKVDRNNVINQLVAKLSFSKEQIIENVEALISAILKAKPPAAKGQYLCSFFLSSTMGAGIKIDMNSLAFS